MGSVRRVEGVGVWREVMEKLVRGFLMSSGSNKVEDEDENEDEWGRR